MLVCDVCKKNKATRKITYPTMSLVEEIQPYGIDTWRTVRGYKSNEKLAKFLSCSPKIYDDRKKLRLRKKLRKKFIKERNKEYEGYYSNCLFEAIKAKIKWGKQIKIIYIPSWKNEVFCPHFMWHDLATDTIKDFHAEHGYIEKWYNLFCFKGISDVAHIQCMKDG